jgi:hypothetical protein
MLGVVECVVGVFIWGDGSALHCERRQPDDQKMTDATNAFLFVSFVTRAA